MKRLLAFLLLLAPFASAQVVVNPGGGGSATSSGSTISGCTSSILYADASSLLKCDPAAVVNGSVSTAGRSILTIRDTATSGQAFLDVTGAIPASLSGTHSAVNMAISGSGQSQVEAAQSITFSGTNPTGGFGAYGLRVDNQLGGTYSYGIKGAASGAANASVGVVGQAYAGTFRIGGYFALANQDAPSVSGALIADNGAVAANIFEARDNGTAVFTIADGGASTFTAGLSALTVTMSGTGATNSMGLNSALTLGGSTVGAIGSSNTFTPDGPYLGTGSLANSFQLAEFGDTNFDFQNACTTGLGTVACTDPTLIVHSHNQDTGEFLSMAHDGKAGVIVGGNSTVLDGLIRLGGTVTLTESTATTVLTIPIPVTTGSGGFINYVVDARDATNVQIRTGNVSFAVANTSGGTETCNVFGIGPTTQAVGGNTTNPANPTEVQDGSGTGAITSGTLTYAWSVDTTGTNSCVLKLNAVSSLTQTTLQVHYTVISTGPAIVTGG